jgi:hypothetical protein
VYSQEEATSDGPERNLMALQLDTLSSAPLTNLPKDETAPAFSPDGTFLIFVGEQDGTRNLYRLDWDGRVQQLTRVVGGNFSPVLSSDGLWMVFTSFRRTSLDIYRAPASLWNPAAVSLSPEPAAPAQKKTTASLPVQPAGRPGPERGRAPNSSAAASADSPKPPQRASLLASQELFISTDHPYRFRASTDLFFPLFFYSSTDGLFMATLWQASEYLGNHTLQTTFQYSSGNDFLDYQVQYQYKRFRPQFILGSEGQHYYRDFSKNELRREWDHLAGVVYPFDRYHRGELFAASVLREDQFPKVPQFNEKSQESLVAASLVRDTVAGRYLSEISGNRLRATYQIARPVFGGNREYKTHAFEVHQFVPTGRDSAFAFRGLSSISNGTNPQSIRLGGVDRLRGYSRNGDGNHSSRFVVGNLEWRVPLKYLNYTTWFIFPDFYFRSLQGVVFTDAGYDWSRSSDLNHLKATRVRHSVGGGLRVPTFILQTFLITLSMDIVKRTDSRHWVWYFSLGPEF